MTASETPQQASPQQASSPFWRFSLRFYAQPAVADACIALQDACGVDVNILLFLLWLASTRLCLAPDTVRLVCAKAGRWRDDVVAPLRAVRRALKACSPLVEPAARERLRLAVKKLELESERLQQEALFALAHGLPSAGAPSVEAAAAASIKAYERVLERPLMPEGVAALIDALSADRPAGGA